MEIEGSVVIYKFSEVPIMASYSYLTVKYMTTYHCASELKNFDWCYESTCEQRFLCDSNVIETRKRSR